MNRRPTSGTENIIMIIRSLPQFIGNKFPAGCRPWLGLLDLSLLPSWTFICRLTSIWHGENGPIFSHLLDTVPNVQADWDYNSVSTFCSELLLCWSRCLVSDRSLNCHDWLFWHFYLVPSFPFYKLKVLQLIHIHRVIDKRRYMDKCYVINSM